MRGKRFSIGLRAVLAIFTVTLLATSAWAASKYRVLHFFNGNNGVNPNANLIFDGTGNLYGTTAEGGAQRRHGVRVDTQSRQGLEGDDSA